MLSFKGWISVVGYIALILLVAVLGVLFVDLVLKSNFQGDVKQNIKSKAEAHAIDLWRVLPKSGSVYHLKAALMERQKNGEVLLKRVQLWYNQKGKGQIYVRADKAVVYPDNSVDAYGHVCAYDDERFKVCTSRVNWNNSKKLLSSKASFNGTSKKSRFMGEGFDYYYAKDMLVARRVNIWLK